MMETAEAERALVAIADPWEWGEGDAPEGHEVVAWFAHIGESLYMIARREDGNGWDGYCLYPSVSLGDGDITLESEVELKAACAHHHNTGAWPDA